MRGFIILLLAIFIGSSVNGQPIVSRSGGMVTVLDSNFFAGKSFRLPQFSDTSSATVALDSCGKMAYVRNSGLWYRECNPKRWVQITNSSGSINIYNSNGSLTSARTLTLNGNDLRIAGTTTSTFLSGGNVIIGGTSTLGSYSSAKVLEIQNSNEAYTGIFGGVSGTNASGLFFGVTPSLSVTQVSSIRRNSGSLFPLVFGVGGIESARIDTNANVHFQKNLFFPNSSYIDVSALGFDIWDTANNYTSGRLSIYPSVANIGYQSSGIYNRYLQFSSSAMTVIDDAASKGLVNSGDYESNFTARSLVTKQYVDGAYTAGYGLSLSSSVFRVDTTTIQKKLSAGTGISISGNTIYNTGVQGGGISGQVAYFNGSNSLTSNNGVQFDGVNMTLAATSGSEHFLKLNRQGYQNWLLGSDNNSIDLKIAYGTLSTPAVTFNGSNGNATFSGSVTGLKFTATGGTAAAGTLRFSSNTLILNAGSSGLKIQSDDGTSDWVTATATTFTIGDATYTNPFVHWDNYTLFTKREFSVTTNPASPGATTLSYLGSTSTTNGQAYVLNTSSGAMTTLNPSNLSLKSATGANTITIRSGNGSPEGVVTASIGSLYLREDGGAGTTLYVKESGTGNTGWASK